VGSLADGRTVRSLAYLLGKFDRVKLYFVAPTHLQIKHDILDYLTRHGVWWTTVSDLRKVLPEVDVVYSTRLEPERLQRSAGREGTVVNDFFIDTNMASLLPAGALIMHPLPRLSEIDVTVDDDPRAAYFRQTRYGVLIRMALLSSVLS